VVPNLKAAGWGEAGVEDVEGEFQTLAHECAGPGAPERYLEAIEGILTADGTRPLGTTGSSAARLD
jgi:hypothetical protein